MHSTWPNGNAMARRIKRPEFDYGQYLFFLFSSPFLFSFCLIFLLLIAVLFLYIALVFLNIYKFSSVLPIFPFNFLPFPRSPSRGLAIHAFLVNLVLKKRNVSLKVQFN